MKFLLVGLGNPGREYLQTRHNVGFMVMDRFAERRKTSFTSSRLGDIAECSYRGKQLVLLKPTTFMNNSGRAVAYWLTQEKLRIEQLLVVVDDLALPLGTLRMRLQGSDGGHNGLKSIAEQLNNTQYPRLRIGIGNEFSRGQQVNYVLDSFPAEEQETLNNTLDAACDALEMGLARGWERAMNEVNTTKKSVPTDATKNANR